MKKTMNLMGTGILVLALTAACATSPAGRIESRLLNIGIDAKNARCLANELDAKLDRSELTAVADFLDGLDRSDSPGEAIDALLSIDDPGAAAGVARAGFACALERFTG